jgi:hypothetical protein
MLRFLLVLAFTVPGMTHAQDVGLAEWVRVEGGEDTRCAFGTPYRFFYRPGADTTRLLIYFQGGGACWDWVSCSGMFDTSVDGNELREYRGIFDFSNPANPFRDYAVLFVPYCTGDVHVGAAKVSYSEEAGARPVAHCGARNVESALVWVRDRIDRPVRVVVAGASAGSYGAVFHAPRIAALYPSAALVTVGDSGVPLLNGYEEILERWGAGSVLRPPRGGEEKASLTLERAYQEAAAPPNMEAIAQITSDHDAVQSAFYLISGSPSWREETYALLDRLERWAPSVHSFVVSGADHGLMRTDAFYEYAAGGTRLADWVARLVSGEPVGSVRCDECRVR